MISVKKAFSKIMGILNRRDLVLIFFTCIIAVVYIVQLFNLQIINGSMYREQSEKRMLRTEKVQAPRGEIYDRNGIVLATSKLSFDIDLYKVRIDNETQNKSIFELVKILDSNGEKISSTFPVNDELTDFSFDSDAAMLKWKKELKIDEGYNFNQTIDEFIKRYELGNIEDRAMQIKIIKIKYEGNLTGYSLFNSVTIAKDVKQETVAQIEEKKSQLYGINVISVPKRYYPNSMLTAHVVGYVSKVSSSEYGKLKDEGYTQNSVIGKAGIEQSFDKYLKGIDGANKVETDIEGNVANEFVSKEPISGKSVTLTLDYRLQKTAEEALANTINGLREGTLVGKKIPDANAGSVVVLDTDTGEVLAMANYPSYDTNVFVNGITKKDWDSLINDPVKPMYNRAISGTYSPGSTYKMLVGIAGLKTGKVTVDEKIRDTGIYPYGHKPKCWIYSQYGTTHGLVNLAGAIKGSCNCYFYEVGRRIGINEIVKYSKEFGLGEKTGIEISNEVNGLIAGDGNPKEWYLGDTLNASIGQSSHSYTPIQFANYISAIANEGNLNKVSLIKEVKSESDSSNSVSTSEIDIHAKTFTGVDFNARKIELEPSYISAVKEGMLSVTSEVGGTASIIFKNSNIQVAGKTGTSQVTSGSNNGIFVGFAPYDKPKIAVVAIIEHGSEGTYTANVVRPIMEEYFKISVEDKANEREQKVSTNKINF